MFDPIEKPFSSMTSEEQLEEGIKAAMTVAKNMFDPDEDELPFGIALANKDKDGVDLGEPQLVVFGFDPKFLRNREMKDNLLKAMKKLTKDMDALFMIFICRAWSAVFNRKIDLPESLENYKDKTEVKMIIIDHKVLGSTTYLAPITPNKDGVLELGEFEKTPIGEGNMIGAFFDRSSN